MGRFRYDYVIMTAAITRPDLHRRIFPAYRDLIGTARVKWLVNVDDVGTGHSVDETAANLTRLVHGAHVDLEFLPGGHRGCFLHAAGRLAARAAALAADCRTGFVWLEDDWQRRPRNLTAGALCALRQRLSRNREGGRLLRCPGDLAAKQAWLERHAAQTGNPLWFVSLVPRSRVSFNPGIWSKALFERAIRRPLAKLAADDVDDPETLCADPWNEPAAYRTLEVFVDPLFQDAGRRWSAEQGFVKWHKQPAALKEQGLVTYLPRHAPRGRAADVAAPRGWLTIAGAGAPSWLVGKVGSEHDTSIARLIGVPSPFVELRVVDPGQAEMYLHRLHGWARTYPLKKIEGRIAWRPEDRMGISVETAKRTFHGHLGPRMPLRALWMVPLQALASVLIHAATLARTVTRLDAE